MIITPNGINGGFLNCRKVGFSGHAIKRMFEHHLTRDQVKEAVQTGEIIKDYPEDDPLPSVLILGYSSETAIHAVVGYDIGTGFCMIITAYPPGLDRWEQDLRTRKLK